jgi:hypothetical protein
VCQLSLNLKFHSLTGTFRHSLKWGLQSAILGPKATILWCTARALHDDPKELIDASAHCANHRFVREGNRWLFAEREVITDGTDRHPDFGSLRDTIRHRSRHGLKPMLSKGAGISIKQEAVGYLPDCQSN